MVDVPPHQNLSLINVEKLIFSRIVRQNKLPATSPEPISLCCLKRQQVAYCIYRQNIGCKFGFIWLQRVTNARGCLCKCSKHTWQHKNRWWVVRQRWNVTTNPCGVNSIHGNTWREVMSELVSVVLFHELHWTLFLNPPPSFSVDFYLTPYQHQSEPWKTRKHMQTPLS